MLKTEQVAWQADFALRSPLFEPLRGFATAFSRFTLAWPDLPDYQQVLAAMPEPILTQCGRVLRIVPQAQRPQRFEEHYAPRVYHSGELQTRRENWHDFFQLLSWLAWPHTKAAINALHIAPAEQRLRDNADPGRRTPLENMLSLFDEGGALVMASDASLLQLIRDFEWKQLFWTRRDELASKLRCIGFGHALFEKGLHPYVGMTANSILLEVAPELISLPMARLLPILDARLAVLLSAGIDYRQPKDLQPFPILGMPGWDAKNVSENYYDNLRYFRSGRTR